MTLMDSINIYNLKFDKSDPFAKHRRVANMTTLFRFVELFVFLVLISTVFVQFAFSAKLSSDCFHRISTALFHPRFMFLIGNAIVITLSLKSGWLSEKYKSSGNKPTSDFCAENVEKSICEYQRRANTVVFDRIDTDRNLEAKKIYRSQSERKSINRDGEKQIRQLRRSVTENLREIQPAVGSYMAEKMSGEEFRQTVEAFIARQQRFLREEELQTVVSY